MEEMVSNRVLKSVLGVSVALYPLIRGESQIEIRQERLWKIKLCVLYRCSFDRFHEHLEILALKQLLSNEPFKNFSSSFHHVHKLCEHAVS